jgi:uncharacterized protein YbcI
MGWPTVGAAESVQEVTGVKALNLHYDISTVTGKEVVLFTLAGLPQVRETRKK